MKDPNVIFEDDNILILDKPAGWVVNKARTTKGKKVVQDYIARNFSFETANDPNFRSGIVHRIDKETSGILVLAKNKTMFKHLQVQFKERKVKKTYTALVHGRIFSEEGVINAPLGRLPWNRERFGVVPGGRESETRFKVISFYKKDKEDFTLLNIFPKTGRTHQIRVHLKYFGFPIVSDNFYSGRKRSKKDLSWCSRLFLHASQIEFHDIKGKLYTFKIKLPKDLNEALSNLEKTPQ